MAKFKIYKSTLLAQLSHSQRISLIGDFDLPDVFIFDGIPVDDKPDPLDDQYAHVRAKLTRIPWMMFKELTKHPGGVSTMSLAKFCHAAKYQGDIQFANAVAVHIKNMRQALAKHDLPYTVLNLRGYGTYKLEPLT
jgi:DNA-binding response OmpR family regulator